MDIDWESLDSHILANPRLPKVPFPSAWSHYSDFKSHIWIATSGTCGNRLKWVALTKSAFLTSAHEVNSHLQSNASDRWLNALPLFHVGGLSIYARAFLSNASVTVFNEKWNPKDFYASLIECQATLTALVPTQLFDLIQLNLKSPVHLRALIIGGGYLRPSLYQEARAFGWPVLQSYGMTECASQIATATFQDSDMQILPHVACKLNEDGRLKIKSPSLLTGYLEIDREYFHWIDPKETGWFTTDDRVEIDQNRLKFLGRMSDWIKIAGENVSVFRLERQFEEIKPDHVIASLIASKHDRLGYQIEVMTLQEHEHEVSKIITYFNEKVMPYERIRMMRFVDDIPRNCMGKIIKNPT